MLKITKEAMQRWNQIPDDVKPQLLSNVYCSKCKDAVTIINFQASMDGNDLILKGNCTVCNHNVARLIEGPEDDILEFAEKLSIEDVDKMFDNQINENNILLKQFEQHLYSQKLVTKTVKKHVDNIDFFINTFTLHYEIETPQDAWHGIDMYFHEFMPNKTTFGSVNDTKSSIASLKKFYKYLVELKRLSKNDYDEILDMIKNNKDEWFDVYDDEFEDDDW